MPEGVARADADDGDGWMPHGSSVRREPVAAAVVRDLQHFDRMEESRLCHTQLGRLFCITREYDLDVTGIDFKHDAGVVGARLRGTALSRRRPQYSHLSRADVEPITRTKSERAHPSTRRQPRYDFLERREAVRVCR